MLTKNKAMENAINNIAILAGIAYKQDQKNQRINK